MFLATLVIMSQTVPLSDFVATGATIQKLPQEFMFTEGPVWTKKGTLMFTDIPANKIYEWNGKEFSVFREPSRNANGLTIDSRGNLYTCEHSGRAVTRTSTDGKVEELVTSFNSKRFNSPNDVAIHTKSGAIVFTDPSYGLGNKPSEIGYKAVFAFHPKKNEVVELYKGKNQPNGVVFSIKGDFVYIADSGAGVLEKFKYDGKPFAEPVWSVPAPNADGIRVDMKDNVWAACKDGVRIYSPEGQVINTIAFPEQPANLCFGGKGGKTLYVTARKGVYSLELSVAGLMPGF